MNTPEIIHLYQLSRLEIPGDLLASALFDDLKKAISCDAMTLLWQHSMSAETRVFHESETAVNCGCIDAHSFNQIFSTTDAELYSLLKSEHPLLQKIAIVLPNVQHVIEQNLNTLVVYFTDSRKRTGAIMLHRPRMEQFSTTEKATLIRLAPILSNALKVDTDTSQFITSECNAGILLLDNHMNIQYACSRGRKLIHLSQASNHKMNGRDDNNDLHNQLRNHFGPEDIARSSNFIFRNSWGSFQFRLHRLSDAEIHSDQLIAVRVHRQEPLPLSVLRGCRKLALTEKQTEISLLLIKGLSYDAVAAKLCIKSNTVIDHVRKIYEKVGAGNRSELVTTLLLGAKKKPHLLPFYDAA